MWDIKGITGERKYGVFELRQDAQTAILRLWRITEPFTEGQQLPEPDLEYSYTNTATKIGERAYNLEQYTDTSVEKQLDDGDWGVSGVLKRVLDRRTGQFDREEFNLNDSFNPKKPKIDKLTSRLDVFARGVVDTCVEVARGPSGHYELRGEIPRGKSSRERILISTQEVKAR